MRYTVKTVKNIQNRVSCGPYKYRNYFSPIVGKILKYIKNRLMLFIILNIKNV